MARRHPPRLADDLYLGLQRYFVTICCADRRAVLNEPAARDLVLLQLRATSEAQRFAVIAYVLMPDHLHFVCEAEQDRCDLRAFVRAFKQVTSYAWRQRTGSRLWQSSFYDHVLRDAESTRGVVRYVLENPVRAALVGAPEEYPHSGSLVYEHAELIEWAFGWRND